MLGFNPLSSRPFSDVVAETRLAVLAAAEDDDTLSASATLAQPKTSPGQKVRRRPRGPVFAPIEPQKLPIHAQLDVAEADDTLVAFMVMAEAPAARRRRQTLNLLLMQ